MVHHVLLVCASLCCLLLTPAAKAEWVYDDTLIAKDLLGRIMQNTGGQAGSPATGMSLDIATIRAGIDALNVTAPAIKTAVEATQAATEANTTKLQDILTAFNGFADTTGVTFSLPFDEANIADTQIENLQDLLVDPGFNLDLGTKTSFNSDNYSDSGTAPTITFTIPLSMANDLGGTGFSDINFTLDFAAYPGLNAIRLMVHGIVIVLVSFGSAWHIFEELRRQ